MDTLGGQDLGVGGLDSQQHGNEAPVSIPAQRGTPPGDLNSSTLHCATGPIAEQTEKTRPGLARVGNNDYQYITPLVFASLVPRFREPQLDSRTISSSGLAIIELLVGRGASVESRPGFAWWQDLLFHETCRDYDSPEAMELLARAGADYHTKLLNDYYYSVLQAAAARGAVRTVDFLLNRGVPMHHIHREDDRSRYGRPQRDASPCSRCEWKGPSSDEVGAKRGSQEETVRLLVDAGADLTALDQRDLDWCPYVFDDEAVFPDTPLGHVSVWGSGDLVRYLADRRADIHRRCSYLDEKSFPYVAAGDNVTPLHRAALNWNADAVQALLDLGADPAASDEYGRQAQHWAAMGKCVSVMVGSE
ncbi:ankyrin [Coniochaeta sp. PMI_546]|nr:ankyrin [Coniochaeta sp. PMI_546]